jgi:hypothetical protein
MILGMVAVTETPMADTPDWEKWRQFLETKWKGTVTCPVCKTSGWKTFTKLVYSPLYNDTAKNLPFVMVYCKNCAYSLFFPAVLSGVLPSDPPDQDSGGSGNG